MLWVCSWSRILQHLRSLFAALHIINEERKEKRREAEELPYKQALMVNAWCEQENDEYILFGMNSSPHPVFDVMIYGSPVDFVPHESGPPHNVEVLFGTLAPGRLLDDKTQSNRLKSDRFGEPIIELEFTDSSGRHWRRGGYDRELKEIKSRRPFD